MDEDEEEDTFQMVSKSHQAHGTVETSVEGPRAPCGRKKPSHEFNDQRSAIVAKRDWSVLIEPQDARSL
jgi:hypothetical protein